MLRFFSFAPACHDVNMAADLHHTLLQTRCSARVCGALQSWTECSETMAESNLSFLSHFCHILVTDCGRNYHNRLLRKRLRDTWSLMKRTKAQATSIVLSESRALRVVSRDGDRVSSLYKQPLNRNVKMNRSRGV